MPNVTTVTLTSGVPTAPSGTVSTIDALMALYPAALGAGGGFKIDGSGTPLPISGTITVNALPTGANLIGKVGIDQTTPGTTNGVQVNAALPAGTNIIGAALAALSAAANGLTSSRVNSAASTNATSLKASAGNVGEIDVFNNAAYAVYLKFYNKASAPTVGTDTPTWTIPIPSGGGFARSFPRGKSFATGIAYAITKLQADSDTTVIVAGDLTGSIDWI